MILTFLRLPSYKEFLFLFFQYNNNQKSWQHLPLCFYQHFYWWYWYTTVKVYKKIKWNCQFKLAQQYYCIGVLPNHFPNCRNIIYQMSELWFNSIPTNLFYQWCYILKASVRTENMESVSISICIGINIFNFSILSKAHYSLTS
jgi:hypothetical protein